MAKTCKKQSSKLIAKLSNYHKIETDILGYLYHEKDLRLLTETMEN